MALPILLPRAFLTTKFQQVRLILQRSGRVYYLPKHVINLYGRWFAFEQWRGRDQALPAKLVPCA
jgi:hypothetical protein